MRWLAALTAAGCASTPASPLGRPLGVTAPRALGGQGELVLRCAPTDAQVALDGVSQGLCSDFDGEPNALKVGSKARRVEVKKQGFEPWESWLAADRTRVVMTVTLKPFGGSP